MSVEDAKHKKMRNMTDDLIRALSAIFVIMIHADNKPWKDIPVADAMAMTTIFFSNSFFFMLSGKYNIGQTFSTPNDYLVYYKKKIVDILFPYVFVSMLLSTCTLLLLPDMEIAGEGRDATQMLAYYIKFSIKGLFDISNSPHLWFMLHLTGFIVSAPFLSKMFHAMSNRELHVLLFVGVLWNTVAVLLFPLFSQEFSYRGWFLYGWIIHFCLGYYMSRVLDERNAKWFYIIGGIGFVLNVIGITFAPARFRNPFDLAPTFIFACAGAMAFLQQKVSVRGGAETVVKNVAKHTFVIYMVHYFILRNVAPLVTDALPQKIHFVADVAITFALSLTVAVVLDFVINPCKRWLRVAMQ